MSTLDDITKEKQRVSEALARVDAQRERLTSQLSELEATERVLARYSKGTPTRRTASAKTPTTATQATAPARQRGRRRATTAKSARAKRGSSSLSDQVLALATGKTQQEIAAACKGVRPNHVGAALSRHKRAGRVEERDGRLYATQSAGTEQRTAV
jgi:cell wall-associated NlpC family hydrolase